MNYENRKTPLLGVIMNNPTLSRQMREAWFAKAGSTKRSKARSTMRSINKIGQRRGISDGMGGATSTSALYDPTTTTYGSTTPAMGTTTEFANPQETGTTQPRKTLSPENIGKGPEIMYPQDFSTYKDRFLETLPSSLIDFASDPGKTFRDVLNKGAAEMLDWAGSKIGQKGTELGKKTWPQSIAMVKDFDSAFQPYEGIGELLVNDMSRGIMGTDATQEERLDLANKNAGEVRKYYQAKKARRDLRQTPSAYDQYTVTGETGLTDEQQATIDEAEAEQTGAKARSLMETILQTLPTDREGYLNSLSENNRALADKMLEYADAGFSKDMATAAIMEDIDVLKKAFPGVPVGDLPIGAFSEEAIRDMRNSLEAQYGLKDQWDKLAAMKDAGYGLEDRVTDYIKSQDSYISTIDRLMDKTLASKYSGRQLTEREKIQTDTYLNFLTKMRGNQTERYTDWLNKATTEYDNAYQRAADQFDRTTQWIDYEMAKEEPVTEARYNMYKTYMDGMYDQISLMSTNARVAQEATLEKFSNIEDTIKSIISLGVAVNQYAPESIATPFLESLGISGEKAAAAISAAADEGLSTKADDAKGQFTDSDGNITDYNLYNAMITGRENEISGTTVNTQWKKAVGDAIYQKALGDYSLDSLKEYENAMDELRQSDDFATNEEKRTAWQTMNDLIYKNYINGVREKLASEPDQVEAIAKYVKYLSGMDYSDIIKDGKVYEGAKKKAKNRGFWRSKANIDPSLEDQIWNYFTYYLNPPANIYGGAVGDYALAPNKIFSTTGDDSSIANDVLKKLLFLYQNANILEDYNKAYNIGAIQPESTGGGTKTDQEKALEGTILGELINK